MKYRKLVYLLLACLFLSACKAEPALPTIGLCYRDADESACYRKLEAALQAKGYAVSAQDARGDQALQDEQIAQLIGEGCDLMVIEPVMVTTASSTVNQLRDANIPGLFLTYEPEETVLGAWDKVSFVGCDRAQPGLLQGSILLQTPDRGDINGDGVVSYMVIQGPEDSLDACLRTENCMDALGPQAQCLSLCCCDWDAGSGRAACARELMNRGSKVEAVLCGNDAMAQGALQAIRDSGRQVGQDIYLIGMDGSAKTLDLVRRGEMTGTVAEDVEGQIDKVTQIAGKLLSGQPVEKRYYVEHLTVTKQSAQQYMQEKAVS